MTLADPHITTDYDALGDPARVIAAMGWPDVVSPRIQIDWIDTPLGPMMAATDRTHLHLLEFTDRKALRTELRRLGGLVKGDIGFGRTPITDQTKAALDRYFQGGSATFEVAMALHGTPFTRAVWATLQDIPAGETCTYNQLATMIGRPDATRAVARANGANQIAILIPCHRIVATSGDLTGYGGGLWRKQRLIDLERIYKRTPQ